MDHNNWRANPSKAEPAPDPNDWRSHLQPDSRGKIVNKITETLKRHLPCQDGVNELRKIAVRFEEKIYAAATSQPDYLRKITLMMLTMETKSQTNNASSLPTNSGGNNSQPSDLGSLVMPSQVHNQGQSIHIPLSANQLQPRQQLLSQNIPNNNIASAAAVQSSVPQTSNLTHTSLPNVTQNSNMQSLSGVSQNSSVFANSQRQMQGRQQVVSQQASQQQSQNSQQYLYQQMMMKQKLQQQNLLQTNQLQPGQQSGMQTSSSGMIQSATLSNLQQNQQSVLKQPQPNAGIHQQQPSMVGSQSNGANMQQNQLIGQQANVGNIQQPQQRLLSQQNNNLPNVQQQQQLIAQQNNRSNLHQQQLGSQSNMSGLQHQQQLLGTQVNHHSMHMLQQPKLSHQQQSAPNQPQPQSQQQQLMPHNMQSQPAQMGMQQRLQASGQPPSALLQQQNVIDQQKQMCQTQRALPETLSTSLDSTSQTGQASGGDWQEEVYQKIKAMKDMYCPGLTDFYHKITDKLQQHESHPQQPKSEQLEKLKTFKIMLERMIAFLQVPKETVQPTFKEKLGSYEKQIMALLNTNRTRKPGNQIQMQHSMQSQITQAQTHENQSGMTSLESGQVGVGSVQPNPAINSQNGVNMLQSNNITQLQSNNMLQQQMLQTQQLKQMQQRQLQQQMMQKQLQQINDVDDMKVRQGIGIKPSGTLQQHMAAGPRSAYPHQQLKPGAISSPQMLQAASPQLHPHSSPQLKTESEHSPFFVLSPSTPLLAPSPMIGESEKPVATISSLSNAGNMPHQQTMGPQSNAIGTPRISASPLLAEFTSSDGTQLPTTGKSEQPLEHLVKAVKSISSKGLEATIEEIGSVVCMMDRIAGSAPGNGSRAAVGEDLAAMTNCRRQARNFITQDGSTGSKKMKRYVSAIPLNVVSSAGSMNESYKQLTGSDTDLESTATSGIKRRRLEVNHTLLKEIREINHRLIDTIVDINDEDFDLTSIGGEGTIVMCSYIAVSLSPYLKSQYGSARMSPIQPMRLLVPANYPDNSPIPLDKLQVESSTDYEDLSVKTKSRFSRSLRTLSQPMSIKDIATTWDACARAVITELAQESGGGTFSSKYGSWEDCSSAT